MEEKKQCQGMIYQVKSGDTLYRIAKMHGIKVRDLMLANPCVNVYQLQIGDELCVPVFSGMEQISTRPYRVGKNETLGKVQKKTNLSYEELVKMNKKLEGLPIEEGTVLLIPQKNPMQNSENTLENKENLT